MLILLRKLSTKWLYNSPCDVAVLIEPPVATVLNLDGKTLLEQTIPDQALKESLHYKNVVYDFSECDNLIYKREIQRRLIYLDKSRLIKEVKANEGEIKRRVVYIYSMKRLKAFSELTAGEEITLVS